MTTSTAQTIQTAVAAYLKEIGAAYSASFVPKSLSRNSGEKEPSLNWCVAFARKGQTLSTDYMQGIGHMPGHSGRCVIAAYMRERVVLATEKGLAAIVDKNNFPVWGARIDYKASKLVPPHAVDVLYSLILDASVLDYDNFESWANDYGYDTDSREAERTYNACRASARDFARVFTVEQRAHLADLLQGY